QNASAAADRTRSANAYSSEELEPVLEGVVGGLGSDMAGRLLPGWTHPNGAGRRLTQRDRWQALGGTLGVVAVEVFGDGLGDQLGDLAVEHGGMDAQALAETARHPDADLLTLAPAGGLAFDRLVAFRIQTRSSRPHHVPDSFPR